MQDGKTLTTDGPFAETKEAIGGYLLFEAERLDAAIELPRGSSRPAWEARSRCARSWSGSAPQALGAGGGSRTHTPREGTPAFKAGASHPFRHPGGRSVGGRPWSEDAQSSCEPRI